MRAVWKRCKKTTAQEVFDHYRDPRATIKVIGLGLTPNPNSEGGKAEFKTI